MSINSERLLKNLEKLGNIGRNNEGHLSRIALTDEDKAGREQFVKWIEAAGLTVEVDKIGNIFGVWCPEGASEQAIMMGSHIDTVRNAGIYDGNYGVLSGLEVIQTLKESGYKPKNSLVVAAFTNEEGARYAPDMMGSLVYAGGLDVEETLSTRGVDGSILGKELERIGFAGNNLPGFIKIKSYVELHIEQGPVLEREGYPIGAVANLQGISWQKFTVKGVSNHAGTTPMNMRNDAGIATATIMTKIREAIFDIGPDLVTTIGTIKFEPNVINVIPSKAEFTVDLRSPNEENLKKAEEILSKLVLEVSKTEGVDIETERLVRFEPVIFDQEIVEIISSTADELGLPVKTMTSGAGHDAQMIARISPAAMIFVPSKDGISHNPKEYTEPEQLIAGANVLLDVIKKLSV